MTRISEAEYASILRRQTRRPRTATALPCPTEALEQERLMEWAHVRAVHHPALDLLYHIPNENAHHKMRQGVQAGVPDLHLPVARGGYHGLWLELKRADHSNGPSPAQKAWLERLECEGYRCAVCYGAAEAIDAIEQYLAMS